MSELSIAPFFGFSRMKISSQTFSPDRRQVHLAVRPDARATALCHQCGTACPSVHSWTARPVRDLDLAGTRVTLDCALRKVFCPACGRILIEQCEAAHPYRRVTPRLARYVYALCKKMSLADVAAHVGLDWKKYVEIDPRYYRPAEVDLLVGDYSKAKRQLGWEPRTRFEELVKLMVDADIELLRKHRQGEIKVAGG